MAAHASAVVAPVGTFAVLAAAAFVPALLLAGWVRRGERHAREPLQAVLRSFGYGATTGVLVALLLHTLFDVGFPDPGAAFGLDKAFFATIIAAPFAEELAKGMGLGLRRRRMVELEDGIVYGIAIGLGFGAMENMVYALAALAEGGTSLALGTLATRVFSSLLLHAGATGLLGFGYALAVRRGGVVVELLPYYLMAVLMHAVYNYLVYLRASLGLALAIFLVIAVLSSLRRQVQRLDALPHGTH